MAFSVRCDGSIRNLVKIMSDSEYDVKSPSDQKIWGPIDELLKECSSKEDRQKISEGRLVELVVPPIKAGKVDSKKVAGLVCYLRYCLSPLDYEKLCHLFVRAHVNAPLDDKIRRLADNKYQELLKCKIDSSQRKLSDNLSTTIKTGESTSDNFSPNWIHWVASVFPYFFKTPQKAWENGQKLIDHWISTKKSKLTIEDLIELNNTLRDHYGDNGERGIRTTGAGVGLIYGKQYFEPEFISEELQTYLDWLNAELESRESNPILISGKSHQWFVSIHGFKNGNGRETRLLSDFIHKSFKIPVGKYKEDAERIAVFRKEIFSNRDSTFAVQATLNSLEE